MAQSTNDVFPTSMRIATLDLIRDFMPAARELIAAFDRKASEFDDVIKSGRTQSRAPDHPQIPGSWLASRNRG